MHAHLLEIQKKVGKENFPVIEQAFYPNHKDMVSEKLFFHVNQDMLQFEFLFRFTKACILVFSKLAMLTVALVKLELKLQEAYR